MHVIVQYFEQIYEGIDNCTEDFDKSLCIVHGMLI